MKQIYFLTTILFLTFININAQTVTISDSCIESVNGNYSLTANVNERASYSKDNNVIQWSGARWELIGNGGDLGMHNDANTENPPASSFSPWIADQCDPTGVFTGNGTSTATLGVNDVTLTNVNIEAYPNPAFNFIFISGLKSTENYKIYNVLGAEINKGNTSNDEQIDIQNLTNGIYFLKLDNGSTVKFIKG